MKLKAAMRSGKEASRAAAQFPFRNRPYRCSSGRMNAAPDECAHTFRITTLMIRLYQIALHKAGQLINDNQEPADDLQIGITYLSIAVAQPYILAEQRRAKNHFSRKSDLRFSCLQPRFFTIAGGRNRAPENIHPNAAARNGHSRDYRDYGGELDGE